jgi:hypothetical protein
VVFKRQFEGSTSRCNEFQQIEVLTISGGFETENFDFSRIIKCVTLVFHAKLQ